MGFLDRILRRGNNEPVDDGVDGLSVLTGTTTFCREAITALAARHGTADGGYLELPGSLQREPQNQADPNAVAVMVEGERIGYLPSYVNADARVDLGSRAVRVQIFTEMLPKGLRAEAWAWLGNRPTQ